MRIVYFDQISSTQKVLVSDIKNSKVNLPICYFSEYQTDGIGSRGNKWIGKRGNLFFSFAFNLDDFISVPLQSFSIYFGYLFKYTLNQLGSRVVLKWPNDLYLSNKVGGVITQIVNNCIVCGIGVNTTEKVDNFDILDIEVDNRTILDSFFKNLENRFSWDDVFRLYKKEFNLVKRRFSIDGELDYDGSLIKDKERIYSNR